MSLEWEKRFDELATEDWGGKTWATLDEGGTFDDPETLTTVHWDKIKSFFREVIAREREAAVQEAFSNFFDKRHWIVIPKNPQSPSIS